MKYAFCYFFTLCCFMGAKAQTVQENKQDIYFEKAYQEISAMLTAKKALSFQEAVFWSEYACLDGTISQKAFNHTIDSIAGKMQQMIKDKNLQKHKTAGNWAAFGYMYQPHPYNNQQIFTYDFESLTQAWHPMLVWDLLQKRKGNCQSMPYLYKILANRIGAEAFLTIAPMHCFIKHRDENGAWWNLEASSGTFSRTSYIIESFGITDLSMENGLYMKPLTEKESVALCLENLLLYYEYKYKEKSSEAFFAKCIGLGMQHYPAAFLIHQRMVVDRALAKCVKELGLKNHQEVKQHPKTKKMVEEYMRLSEKMDKLGFVKISNEKYRQLVEEGLQIQKKQTKQ